MISKAWIFTTCDYLLLLTTTPTTNHYHYHHYSTRLTHPPTHCCLPLPSYHLGCVFLQLLIKSLRPHINLNWGSLRCWPDWSYASLNHSLPPLPPPPPPFVFISTSVAPADWSKSFFAAPLCPQPSNNTRDWDQLRYSCNLMSLRTPTLPGDLFRRMFGARAGWFNLNVCETSSLHSWAPHGLYSPETDKNYDLALRQNKLHHGLYGAA